VEDHPVDEVILKGTTVLTFDIGRWCEGHLEVLGRVDDVIICGGSNVNLAEIQTHLDFLFPQQVACFAVADDVWGSTVVVASSGPTLDVIARGLEPFVASAAKPRGLLSMKELPRSESGKIDRIALIDEWRNRGAYSSVV
jgi:O-succinylbenzoic acid--CoA ligase